MTTIDEARNLHPHAEARLAMAMWGVEYGRQNGGCMDFWDALHPSRQRVCVEVVTAILEAHASAGRAILAEQKERAK